MGAGAYEFVIRGARGSVPVCGPAFRRWGGHTTCFSLRTPDGWIVLDAGTGLRHAARAIGDDPAPRTLLLLTHLHLDHLVGLPAFGPLHNPAARTTVMADPVRLGAWRAALRRLFRAPYWPVGLGQAGPGIALQDLPAAEPRLEHGGVRIEWRPVPHPQHCLAFRFRFPGGDVTVVTDAELDPRAPPGLAAFCRGTGFLVCDAHFLPAEVPAHRGWGHASWAAAVRLAQAAGARALVLTHHHPDRDDRAVDALLARARERFAPTWAARENLVLDPRRLPRN